MFTSKEREGLYLVVYTNNQGTYGSHAVSNKQSDVSYTTTQYPEVLTVGIRFLANLKDASIRVDKRDVDKRRTSAKPATPAFV